MAINWLEKALGYILLPLLLLLLLIAVVVVVVVVVVVLVLVVVVAFLGANNIALQINA
jgi:hypothetical protein